MNDVTNNIVTSEIVNGVAIICLNSPETKNLLSVPLTDALVAAIDAVSRDMSVRCIVLTAAGDVFCAGGNIKAMYAREGHFAGGPADIRRSYLHGVQRIARSIDAAEPPVIAAVNGPAMGAGFDIALMCDLRIAAESAVFAESFVKLGLVSAAGGAWFLSRCVSPAVAAELTLTGQSVTAIRALELGIVSRVVPAADLRNEALTLAARITCHSPHAVRLNKRLLRAARSQDLTDALEMAASLQAVAQHTQDQHEAVAAIIEKRNPNFEGR